MEIVINTSEPVPVFVQLIDQIKKAVLIGELSPGAALPSIRQLATDLELNHNTVAKAYRILERESVIDEKLVTTYNFFRDITEQQQAEHLAENYRQQLEHEVQQRTAELVQSEQLVTLGRLSAGIVHEINTPIGAIRSNADLERRAISLIRDVMEQSAVIETGETSFRLARAFKVLDDANNGTQTAIDRINTILQSLKHFARLDQAELDSVDLYEGFESVLTLIQHVLADRIDVVKHYGILPTVRCYVSQINQVFMNLLTNAVQAIDGSGMITITSYDEGPNVVVNISDTGCGIKTEHLQQVFEPGFTTKGVGVGLGLGLAISHRILEDHHGSIDIQSEWGRGTNVTFRLPVEGI